MRICSIILAFLLSPLWSETALAADSVVHARQFVELLRYHEQFQVNQTQCLANAKTIPPESLLADDPDKFFGIRPNTPRWKKVVEAYSDYWKTLCSRPTKDEFLDSLAKTYAAKMTGPQLQAAIKFYSSEVGTKLISAHKSAASEVTQIFSESYANRVPLAVTELNQRLKSIAESNDEECKK